MVWKWNRNDNKNHGTYYDKSSKTHLKIEDCIEGKDFEFVNNWFSCSSDLSANKCQDNNVYFTGLITNASTQTEHESLPSGTMFVMPEDFRPNQRVIHNLKDNKSNYNIYMEQEVKNTADTIEILPNGEVNLMNTVTGWFINLSGVNYQC